MHLSLRNKIVKINEWKQKYLYAHLYSASVVLIKLSQLNQIWLLNCLEGCQYALTSKNIKIAQIKKIIIIHDSPGSINGLLGLLSTFSLTTEGAQIDIYGPKLLHKYIFWGRKYSKTNFRQKLHFHNILHGTMLHRLNLYLCSSMFLRQNYDYYKLIDAQQSGAFNCSNAKNYNVPLGPLYGSFKKGQNFILPDGAVFYSQQFIYGYYLGCEVGLINFRPQKRHMRIIKNMTYVIYD